MAYTKLYRTAILVVGMAACHCACSPSRVTNAPKTSVQQKAETVPPECIAAAKKLLGPEAEVVKYGHLNSAEALEAVVVVRIAGARGDKSDGIPVSRLAILRHEPSGWQSVLNASRYITNEAGYIGIEFIDDSYPFRGYRVAFYGERSDGKQAFVLCLGHIGDPGSVPIEISWNPQVGRYQEFAFNEEPSGFKSEIKNPPHLKNRGSAKGTKV